MDNPRLNNFGKEFIFLPDATRGAVRGLTTTQLEQTGTIGLVTNTLHMLISPGPDHIQKLGGMHKFMNWDKVILTDSGGYQVFSLLHTKKWRGKITDTGAVFKSPKDGSVHELTPKSSIDIQIKLGSDVLVVLDDCANSMTNWHDAKRAVERTLKWARICKDHFEETYGGTAKTGKILTCVIQGAMFRDLREHCATELVKIGFDGYNLGSGLYDETGRMAYDELSYIMDFTPDDKFRYAMGVGKPRDIFECGKAGYTVFDTVLPTRNARHGTLYSTDFPEKEGEFKVLNSKFADDQSPIDSKCDCEACKNHTRAYIHQMLKVGEFTGMTLATIHNLRFYQRLIEGMNKHRAQIKEISYSDILSLI